ncbi:MAG: SpoIIE family protein phosphatase [Acidobacteriota bacterium]
MSTNALNTLPDYALAPQTISIRDRFLEEFGGIAEPLAYALGISIGFESNSDWQWLIKNKNCSCLGFKDDSINSFACSTLRKQERLEISFEYSPIGNLLLCFEETQSHLREVFSRLIEKAIEKVAMQNQEESLLEELSISWESLETIYEISTDLRVLKNPRMVLRRIMDKAVSIHENLKAIFWINSEKGLEPVARKHITHIDKRFDGYGLIHKAVEEGKTFIINSISRIDEFRESDPELALATGVLVVPIATRHAVLGAIEIWSEDRSAPVFDSRAKKLIEALTHQGAIVLENERLMQESIENAKLVQEIEIGSKIQQTLLLGKIPENIAGLKISAMSIPSQRIDGDFYDFIKHEENCLDVIVGDVMGKGIPAALLGAGTKNQIMRAAGQLANLQHPSGLPAPEEILRRVHAQLTQQLMEFDSFVTICYARFDTQKQKLCFVDCGHTKTIHYQKNEKQYFMLEGENLPLGIYPNETYKQVEREFRFGDVFIFYSDGVTEAKSPNGEMFGEARLADCIMKFQELSETDLVQAIRKTVIEFTQSEKFADDFTCVAVKIEPASTAEVKHFQESKPQPESHSDRMEIELKSNLQSLKAARKFVEEVSDRLLSLKPESEIVAQLKLAINEAITNIILHAYDSDPNQLIHLEAEYLSGTLGFQIHHLGRHFNPNKVVPPSFDGSRDGGFGLFIIDSIMDSVEYFCDESGKNFIVMKKKIRRNC